jgi:hypothetical protein
MASSADFFPYHEPNIVQILILTSFFVFLSLARIVCDYLANVGILGSCSLCFWRFHLLMVRTCIGELFVGLVYGAPLAAILLDEWQATFTAVGYLGLIVIVFEGESCTRTSSDLANTAF